MFGARCFAPPRHGRGRRNDQLLGQNDHSAVKLRRKLSMPDRTVTCNATSAEMFSGLQVRAIGEFERGNFLSSLHFDAGNQQKSFLSTGDQQFAAVVENCAGCRRLGAKPSLLRASKSGCATEEQMAACASERCIDSGPGSEGAHAVEGGLSGKVPVDAAIFFF